MPIAILPDQARTFRMNLAGVLGKAEWDRCQDELAAEIRRRGAIRLLVVFDEFTGWERNAHWNDIGFYVDYGREIERIAIVGPPRWRSEALMFACAGLRDAPVEFFAGSDEAVEEARAWLAA